MEKQIDKTLLEHLVRLSWGIIIFAIIGIIIFITLVFFVPDIINFTLSYYQIPSENLQAISPFENMNAIFTIAFSLTFLVLLPIILVSSYTFFKPAMSMKIREKIASLFFKSLIATILGACFGFLVFCKYTLKFLLSNWTIANPIWSISYVIDFVSSSIITFSIIFQIVWIIPLLVSIGLVNAKLLKNLRFILLPLVFIISAFITPPDVISQVFMAIPILICYELGILMSCKGVKNDR